VQKISTAGPHMNGTYVEVVQGVAPDGAAKETMEPAEQAVSTTRVTQRYRQPIAVG
jgi:hypothetical protein